MLSQLVILPTFVKSICDTFISDSIKKVYIILSLQMLTSARQMRITVTLMLNVQIQSAVTPANVIQVGQQHHKHVFKDDAIFTKVLEG